MNNLPQERKFNLLQQKISMAETTLYRKIMANGGKALLLFWGIQQYLGLYFPGAKIKGMFHYAIPLLEKKNIILHLCATGAPYRSGANILKDLIELKDFILEKLPSCKKFSQIY